jgi:VWFA-related protein
MQTVITFSLTQGGRLFDVRQPPRPAGLEGIILPPPRPTNDRSGRVFLVFVDDSHLEPSSTPRVRQLFDQIATQLIHEGDMFGVVSSGPSSIAIDLTYDRRRLASARSKIMATGLAPKDILAVPVGAQGPPEVRHRVHVAFATAYDLMGNLAQIHDRRKVLIYLSNGYDLNPFAETRAKREAEDSRGPDGKPADPETNPFRQQTTFSEADLVSQLAELTRAAVRANVTIYTIDPRGLPGGPDISEPIDSVAWQKHVSQTQDTLRVLAEQTGGKAVLNRNDLDKALQLIDTDTSDYYIVGYYSNNPDPTKRRRRIEITVRRPDVDVQHRTEYTRKPR